MSRLRWHWSFTYSRRGIALSCLALLLLGGLALAALVKIQALDPAIHARQTALMEGPASAESVFAEALRRQPHILALWDEWLTLRRQAKQSCQGTELPHDATLPEAPQPDSLANAPQAVPAPPLSLAFTDAAFAEFARLHHPSYPALIQALDALAPNPEAEASTAYPELRRLLQEAPDQSSRAEAAYQLACRLLELQDPAWDALPDEVQAARREQALPLLLPLLTETPADQRPAALLCALCQEDLALMERFLADPALQHLVPHHRRAAHHFDRAEYLPYLHSFLASIFAQYANGGLGLVACLLAGFAWFLCALHLSQAWYWPDLRRLLPLCLLAVLLGVCSTWLCLVTLDLEGLLIDPAAFTGGDDTLKAIYFIASVGYREELVKLIVLLPLVPVLKRYTQSPHVIMTVCSLVGLGFAMEENLSYLMGGSPGILSMRFLTANFFHMVTTATCGLALVRAFRHPRTCTNEAFATLLVMILLHGLYDFFLSADGQIFGQASILSIIIYLLLARRHLNLMHLYTSGAPSGPQPSKTWIFSLCLCLCLIADVLAMISLSVSYPFSPLVSIPPLVLGLLLGLISNALIFYFFYRTFDEPLR